MTMFKELHVGDSFDWINPAEGAYNSFFQRCVKVDAYRYTAEDAALGKMRVGSLGATVYHVNDTEREGGP